MVQDDDPRPGRGEARVRVLAAGVSFTDAQLRAGTYIAGGPKPPFTPGYELVGVVEELGPGCAKLRVGTASARSDRPEVVCPLGWPQLLGDEREVAFFFLEEVQLQQGV